MNLLHYRDLAGIGLQRGPDHGDRGGKQVTDGPNDQGDDVQRPGRPADHFVAPFANEQAARAANDGALPPDLSLIVKARAGGADYVYAILTGFRDPPQDMKMADGHELQHVFPRPSDRHAAAA